VARPKNHEKHIGEAVGGLLDAVKTLIDSVGGAVARGGQTVATVKQGAKDVSAKGKKIGAAVKAAWASLTPKERAARIRKMHAWRKAKPGAKGAGKAT
jgi:hypothetical protein